MELHSLPLLRALLLLVSIGEALSQSPCEDWEPYKDETCIKAFDSPGLLSYEDVKSYCASQTFSLMTIDTKEKQIFVESFLKSNNIVDNAWIGLKYSEANGYEWSNGAPFYSANWEAGSPKNDTSYCTEIHTEDEEYGKWSEVVCGRKNLIICEKLQLWSNSKVQMTLMNLVKNPVPMGFIYVQLPKEKLPSEIWSLLRWEDVTAEYAGVFFRAEGANSSSFGEIQEENAPRLVSLMSDFHNQDSGYAQSLDLHADNQLSETLETGAYIMGNHDSQTGVKFMISSGEVRPRNMAIRIWKRVE